MAQNFFSVAQLNRYIKNIFTDDYLLNDIGILGEISNYKKHPSGHLYFTLKDETASVSCVMFKNDVYGLGFVPSNGIKVIVSGQVSVYEKTGQYQLYVYEIEQAGVGALYEQFELLKRKLSAEGLFDESRKKPLPRHIKHVAVITSKSGAAVRDVIKVIRSRNSSIRITVVPALVQGEDAAKDIVRGIRDVNKWGRADAVILGRGGGSYEDLQAFNDEGVARAIADSKIFIISAVGHETDFTISDFASDMRAATPSEAAEIVSEDAEALSRHIDTLLSGVQRLLINNYEQKKFRVLNASNRKVLKEPLLPINESRKYVYSLCSKADFSITGKINFLRESTQNSVRLAENMSPLKVLSRGYGIVLKNDEVVNSVNQVNANDNITITLNDGDIKAIVQEHIETEVNKIGEEKINF